MSETENAASRLEWHTRFGGWRHPLTATSVDKVDLTTAASLIRSQAAEITALRDRAQQAEPLVEHWKMRAASARNDALEEAAKVAEATRADMESIPIVSTATRSAIAAAIRAMKEG